MDMGDLVRAKSCGALPSALPEPPTARIEPEPPAPLPGGCRTAGRLHGDGGCRPGSERVVTSARWPESLQVASGVVTSRPGMAPLRAGLDRPGPSWRLRVAPL